MTHFEVLVEELSAETALRILLPRIVPDASFDVRTFSGKDDLLRKLPQRLAGYRSWIGSADVRIVVLVDRDTDDCLSLKSHLESLARAAGLTTLATANPSDSADMCLRIAVEELEAWFIGDVPALRAVYPRIPDSLGHQQAFRDPDAVAGGTAEALERLLDTHGYGKNLAKVKNAAEVAEHMNIESNRSASFCAFRDGLRRLVMTGGQC